MGTGANMSDFSALKISGFDHIEFAVNDLEKSVELYKHLGFDRGGSREILERKLKSILLVQNDIRILLSHSTDPADPVAKFLAKHGEGVMNVAFRCENVVSAFEIALSRGAKVASPPKAYRKDFGSVEQASIKAFGDVWHSFISREGNLFAEGFNTPLLVENNGFGLQKIDHLTTNVDQGTIKEWVGFYETIFGLENTKFFDIHTERTGLYSYVMVSPDGVIKMPVNEPTEAASQIQEFLNVNHGPGIQHVALATSHIVDSLSQLRAEKIEFLSVPHTYYEAVPRRVPNVSEDIDELERHQVLVDGDKNGYLLQIFTKNMVGPLFYEVIQRKGNDGFGEGNFGALFEAIERDQIERGVLQA